MGAVWWEGEGGEDQEDAFLGVRLHFPVTVDLARKVCWVVR